MKTVIQLSSVHDFLTQHQADSKCIRISSLRCYFILFLLHVLLPASLMLFGTESRAMQPQAAKNSALDLVQKGRTFLESGQNEWAKKAFKAALKIDRRTKDAHFELSLLAFKKGNWAAAGEGFGRVLKIDKTHKPALYYRGICYRETGKFKAFVLADIDWKKSERHFKAVLKQDSLFKDTVHQFALLQRFRKKYKEAIKLVHAQIRLRPDLTNPQVRLFRFYEYLVQHVDSTNAISWLEQNDNTISDFHIAEKMRHGGHIEEAADMLADLDPADFQISAIPLYLALCRAHEALDNPEEVQFWYRKALEELQTPVDAGLIFEDLKYIITDEEHEEYKKLKTPAEVVQFVQAFWAEKDPLPAADYNARLVEHYRRLNYAENHYVYDGVRSRFNDPETDQNLDFPAVFSLNNEFDDRGLIFLRHGKPAEIQKVPGLDIFDPEWNNESWIYYAAPPSPEMIFHFVSLKFTWRLKSVVRNPLILTRLAEWDPLYFRMADAKSVTEYLAAENELASMSKNVIRKALRTEKHTWKENETVLPMPFYSATFRGKGDETNVEVYYGYQLSRVLENLPDSVKSIILESGLTFHDSDWNLLKKENNKARFTTGRKAGKDDIYFDIISSSVKPDSLFLAVYSRPLDLPFISSYQKIPIHIPDYSTDALHMSDIILAFDIQAQARPKPGKFNKNGMRILPNPTSSFEKRKPIFLYFELYGLQLSKGETSYSIDYHLQLTKVKKKAKNLFGLLGGKGKKATSIQYKRNGREKDPFEVLTIDAGSVEKGEYILKVTITDLHTSSTIFKERPVIIR